MQCPVCAEPVAVDSARSRFQFSCSRCGLQYELTGAAFRRSKTLPDGLLSQIRAANARGRSPCISIPDIDAFAGRERTSQRARASSSI